jgi:hypothetical protein
VSLRVDPIRLARFPAAFQYQKNQKASLLGDVGHSEVREFSWKVLHAKIFQTAPPLAVSIK